MSCRHLFLHVAGLSIIAVTVSVIIGMTTIDQSPIIGDGREHLAATLNLTNSGVFGSGATPDMLREPGQAIALAVTLKMVGLSNYTLDHLSDPTNFMVFRVYNLVWVGATLLVLLTMVMRQSGSWALCFLTSAIFCVAFAGVPRLVNRLNAEPISMFIFMVAAFLLTLLVTRLNSGGSYRVLAVLVGVAFGLESLVWAQALYIGTIAILLTCGDLILKRRDAFKDILIAFAITMLVQIALISPWVYRNMATFGTPAISGRASSVVFVRLLEAREMTPDEVPCVFYAFSPPAVRDLLGSLIDVDVAQFQSRGRCVRFGRELNFDTGDVFRQPPGDNDVVAVTQGKPDLADSLFYRAYLADRLAHSKGQSGWSLIPKDSKALYKYLLTAPLFIYRGIWSTGPWFLAAILFAAFIGQVICLFRVAFLLPILSHAFHALATHNLPRYHLVELPFWCLALALACVSLLPTYFTPFSQGWRSD